MDGVIRTKLEKDSTCDDNIQNESVSTFKANSDIEENEQERRLEISSAAFQCNLCLRPYTRKDHLRRHQNQKHSGLNKEISGKNTNEGKKKSIQDEIQTKAETIIQCPLCTQSFGQGKANFIKHLQEAHATKTKGRNKENKFQCPLCPKFYASKKGLHYHVISTHVEHKPFECQICKSKNKCRNFIDQKSLDKHTRYIHGSPRFKCGICLKNFKRSSNLSRHKKTHLQKLQVLKLKCQHCVKTFTKRWSLDRHLVLKHEEENPKMKTYPCELCGKICFSLFLLEMHVADAHVVDKSEECQVCGKMFVDDGHLAHHVNKVHSEKQKRFTCGLCSQVFSRRMDFIHHLGVKHGQFFYCDKCDRSFRTKADFDLHSASVSDSSELRCHICLVVINCQCSFKIHIKSHAQQLLGSERKGEEIKVKDEFPLAGLKLPPDSTLNEKRFQCDLCSKAFARSLFLVEHRKKFHPGSKWECKVCGKIFELWSRLTYHERVHSSDRPWECEVCEKKFKSLKELKKHKIIHATVKPHKCLICQTYFNSKPALRTHMGNYHGGERPFKCHLCDTSWVLKSHLDEHLLSHSEGRAFSCDKCDKYFKTNKQLKHHDRVVHLQIDIKRSNILPRVSRKLLNSNDDSLLFSCSICDFETEDGKEVALHNNLHGLPKVLVSKTILCSRHESPALPTIIKVENTLLATSIGNISEVNLLFVKTEQGSKTSSCSLCSPLDN